MLRPLLLLLLVGLTHAGAQQLITPAAISQTAGNALGGYAPDNLINSAGLSSEPTLANYQGVTNTGGIGNTWVTAATGFPNYFNGVNPPPTFLLQLPSESTITHLVVWGYGGNNNEGANFTLEFSTDGGTTFPATSTVATTSLLGTTAAALALPASFDAGTVRLTVTDNAGGRGFSGAGSGDRVGLGEIRFIGAADGDPGPVIDLPASLALTPDGSVQTIEIPVSNSGSTNPLEITSTSTSGTHATAFSVISAPATLAPLASATIQLSLDPAGLSGHISATLHISSNDPIAPAASIPLSGFLHDPRIDTSPTLDFATVDPAGPQVALELTVANTARNNPLTISSVSVSGPGADRFSVSATPASIGPLASATLTVTFDPSGEPGFYSAKLNLSTSDPAAPLTVVDLTARTSAVGPAAPVVISEFMASNDATLEDGDGASSDWIELHNTTAAAVDLAGWSLTDDPNNPTKWTFPDGVTVPARGYLLVFASGRSPGYVDAGGYHHTNFRLSAAGDYLALVGPGATTAASAFDPAFPPQFTDVAYGSFTPPGTGPAAFGYLAGATPGEPNTFPASNPGPEITAVTHSPLEPSASQDLTVTAAAEPRLAPVGSLTLHHRTGFGPTSTVAMTDHNDGTFSASIPASSYSAGDMLRYFVTATDTAANTSRTPAFLDTTGKSQSPEYFGTVVSDPSVAVEIPVFHWFAPSLNAGHTRSGTRASVFFKGRFYDNIFVRQRGQATNSSVSQKFDFNKGDPFYIDDTLDAVGEININGNGADSTYIRQPLAFETYRLAGNAGSLSGFWHMRGNGQPDRGGRPGIWIEQVDGDFLDRNGYDREGDLYKFVQRRTLRPVFEDTTTGIEKKSNPETGIATLQALVDGLNGANPGTFAIDHLDLAQVNNYLAVRCITMDADDIRKNFYAFHDTHGDARWRLLPWDKDFTFGVRGDGGSNLDHPFFGEFEHRKTNPDQWNVLLDVLFDDTLTNRLYLRRLRTVIDTVLENSTGVLDARASAYASQAGQSSSSVRAYLNSRRSYLDNFSHGSDPAERIPASQPAAPDISITATEPNPATNQDHEYIRLTNAEDTEIDISGYSITGGVTFTFAPGTVVPRNGHLYVSPDTLAFRSRPSTPTGGQRLVVVGPYAGHLSNFGETLELRDPSDTVVSTFQTPVDPSDAQLYLRVSEIMYHPADPHPDAEFIELLNTSETLTLDLAGVAFTAGIDFTFPPGTTLAPGDRVLVVYDLAAFQAAHGNTFDASIAGSFGPGSKLSNDGDRIKLDDASGSTVLEFRYNDVQPWPGGTDGDGHSLVLLDPALDPDRPSSWRPSSTPGGDPSSSDTIPYTAGTDPVTYALDPASVSWSGETLTFIQKPGADAADVTPEHSTDLETWSPAGFGPALRTPTGTTHTLVLPPLATGSFFVRLRATAR